MSKIILDEANLRGLPIRERLDKCASILKSDSDESLRWDAVWLAGEIAEVSNPKDPLFAEIGKLMAYVLKHDTSSVVKHEACYQIAARNMREIIPDLAYAALNDKSGLVRHEALESLGLMRAFETKDLISKALEDPESDVRETAIFVMKRLSRLENLKEKYHASKIV